MHCDIQAVFDTEPLQSVLDEIIEAEEQATADRRPTLEEQFPIMAFGAGPTDREIKTDSGNRGSATNKAVEAELEAAGGREHSLEGGQLKQHEDTTKLQPNQVTLPQSSSTTSHHERIALSTTAWRLMAPSELEESVQRIEEMMIKFLGRADHSEPGDGRGVAQGFAAEDYPFRLVCS